MEKTLTLVIIAFAGVAIGMVLMILTPNPIKRIVGCVVGIFFAIMFLLIALSMFNFWQVNFSQ